MARKFCPVTGPLCDYTPRECASYKFKDHRSKSLDDWRECWRNLRIAVSGQKAVRAHAHELDWLELPEHIQIKSVSHERDEKAMAEKAAKAYYKRTTFDESVRIARSITMGAVFRIETEYEGLDGSITIDTLDAAEVMLGSFRATERFLLEERLTTGFLASYIFLRDETGEPTVKHYCAENIVDLKEDALGNLQFILFREEAEHETDQPFSDKDAEFQYRELRLEDGAVITRIWSSEDGDEFGVDEQNQSRVEVREQILSEIPVVLLPNACPTPPPFEPLFEKTRELFSLNSKIQYRFHKMGAPTPHINYTDGPKQSYICGENRGFSDEEVDSFDDDVRDPIVLGTVLETQRTEVSYLYDTGEGVPLLIQERERAKEELEELGGNYGYSKAASNIAEGTERMRQGREAAFVTNYVVETSEALTLIAQWIAFFSGVTDEDTLNAIRVILNTQLSDVGPTFTLTDVRDLLVSGAIDEIIAIRMMQVLLPSEVFGDETTAEEILARIQLAQLGELPNQVIGGEGAPDVTL